jgi:triacylglycerol lipase
VPIAFIATTGEEIFVVFRGTDTIDEWIKDAEFFQVPYTFVPDGGKTEEGFTKVYNSIHESIVDKVNDLIESENFTTLFVTGHSLGAALATLAIPELIENTAFSQPIMYNFASPRVGDATFMRLYDSLIDNSLRVYNTRDEVPTLPPRFLGYTHVKTGTAIVFGKPIRDPFDFERIEDNHIMCNYYNELCDLTSDPEACKEMAGGADGCNA